VKENLLMFTNITGLETALIGAALILLFVVRQFTSRRVLSPLQLLIPAALFVLGLQTVGTLTSVGWLFLCAGVSLGIALGFLRGTSFHIWTDDNGVPLMRGSTLTLMFWIATLAVKGGLTLVEARFDGAQLSAPNAELLLPAAVTLAVQALVVYLRSQDLPLSTSRRPGMPAVG
jgi:hypothetical protein